MNFLKRFLFLFRKHLPDPDVLRTYEEELDRREQALRERGRALNEQLQNVNETYLDLKAMEAILKSKEIELTEAEKAAIIRTEYLDRQRETLEVEKRLLDLQKEHLDQKAATLDSWAAKVAEEQIDIENERAKLEAKAEAINQFLSQESGKKQDTEKPEIEDVSQEGGISSDENVSTFGGRESVAGAVTHNEGGIDEEGGEGGEERQLTENKNANKKPYVVGPLRETNSPQADKKAIEPVQPSELSEEIDLGARRRLVWEHRGQVVCLKRENQTAGETIRGHRIETPYVQMNLDERRIYLILPMQRIMLDEGLPDVASSIQYKVIIDGWENEFEANLSKPVDQQLQTEEITIELNRPIEGFRVEFPKELKGRVFKYHHPNPSLYVFTQTTGNLAKMKCLFDANNKMNPLPRRGLWLLLRDDCQINVTPDVEEDWIWERYRPLSISREKVANLTVKTGSFGPALTIQSENCFSLQGEGVLEDDFVENMPLFTGRQLLLNPPGVNPEGWVVWLQHKDIESKILRKAWTGETPLQIGLPDDLPTDFGQFQLDICDQDDRIPVDSLFFRYMPLAGLEYPRELLVPGPEGFSAEVARIFFENDATDLHVITNEKAQMVENSYLIEIPREYDTASIRISKSPNLGTPCPIQITVPRVRWQIDSAQEWTDIPLKIEKKEVSHECDSNLFVSFSENRHTYEVIAVLDTSRRELQRIHLGKRGRIYSLRLNTFYDTILKSKENIRLSLRIHDHHQRVKEATAIQYVSVFECMTCGFSCDERTVLLQHLSDSHLEYFMRKLSLEEMREYDPGLPHYIYKCGGHGCGFYSKEDSLENPNSKIYNHMLSCLKAGHKKVFSIIDDIDEVRQNVFPHLPDYRKCGLCGKRFETQDEKVQFEHLVSSHEDELFVVT